MKKEKNQHIFPLLSRYMHFFCKAALYSPDRKRLPTALLTYVGSLLRRLSFYYFALNCFIWASIDFGRLFLKVSQADETLEL